MLETPSLALFIPKHIYQNVPPFSLPFKKINHSLLSLTSPCNILFCVLICYVCSLPASCQNLYTSNTDPLKEIIHLGSTSLQERGVICHLGTERDSPSSSFMKIGGKKVLFPLKQGRNYWIEAGNKWSARSSQTS